MKFKYIISILGSLFIVSAAKAQPKTSTVKKETKPQVKTDATVITTDQDMKQNVKHPADFKMIKLSGKENVNKPHKQPELKEKNSASLPITVKPGENLYVADFSAETEGDMPAGWKTKSIGEIKSIEGKGKWLKLDEQAVYETSFNQKIPSNFKVEFDFIANYNEGQRVPDLTLKIFQKGKEYSEGTIGFVLSPNGGTTHEPTRIQVYTLADGGSEIFRSDSRVLQTFSKKNGKNEPVHVALLVKGNNIKAWLDDEKVYDLQEVTMPNVEFDRIGFQTSSYGGPKENYNYYIANVKVIAQ